MASNANDADSPFTQIEYITVMDGYIVRDGFVNEGNVIDVDIYFRELTIA